MIEVLYDMVDKWTRQPWDGVRYLSITQKLGELLDEESHSGKYQGAIVGVLEGTIKSVHEMVYDGILTETEAIHQLRQLLKDSDFSRGAKKLEVELGESDFDLIISIRNLKELNSRKMHEEYNTPTWWKGSVEIFWRLIVGAFFGVILSINVGLIILGLWELLLITNLILSPIGTFMIAYYIRRVRYPSVFRSTYFVSMMIACVSGWIVIFFVFFLSITTSRFFLQLSSVIIFSMMVGGFSGDWLGKRQRYIPYS